MQIIILMHEFLNANLTITYIKINQNFHIGLVINFQTLSSMIPSSA